MSQLKIALAQLQCSDGKPEDNLDKVAVVMKTVGPSHDLVVFPEGFLLGFPDQETTKALAEPLDGQMIARLIQLSQIHQSAMVIGLAERAQDGIYNTSVLISPDGLLLAYRKLHLWVGENQRVHPGKRVYVRSWHGTRLGILICYDVEFPEPARAVATLGADLIVLTNGNMAPYGDTHRVAIRARAQENHLFIAMANRVGSDGPIHYLGESCVAGPHGEILASLSGDSEEVLSATIDTQTVDASRATYDYLKERRILLDLTSPMTTTDGISFVDIE